MLKPTIAVASLNKLSPSTSIVRRFGAPISLKRAITATGSVAEISAPKSIATPILRGVVADIRIPTIKVEITKPGIASAHTGSRFFTRSLLSMLTDASKIRVGRRIYKIIS